MDNSNRIAHMANPDLLYFHKEVPQRTAVKPLYNEPWYQHKELKLEHVPRTRNNPTYTSTVFNTGSYNYNVRKGEFQSETTSQPGMKIPNTTNEVMYGKSSGVN